jgi:hypothetical protein
MPPIIFHITYDIPPFSRFFNQYEAFLNNLYKKMAHIQYLEIFQDGFLWIFKDSETLKKMPRSSNNQIQKAIQSPTKFYDKDLIDGIENIDFKNPPKFHIKTENGLMQEYIENFTKIFQAINDDIELNLLNEDNAELIFPHKNAFRSYGLFTFSMIDKLEKS